MNRIKKFAKNPFSPAGVALAALLVPAFVSAEDSFTLPDAPGGLPDVLIGEGGVFSTIVNVVLLLVGAIAVIMLIIGGVRYIVSGGDSNAVEGAKNTILYAIIGIVVVFLSFALINFLTGALDQDGQAPDAEELSGSSQLNVEEQTFGAELS